MGEGNWIFLFDQDNYPLNDYYFMGRNYKQIDLEIWRFIFIDLRDIYNVSIIAIGLY